MAKKRTIKRISPGIADPFDDQFWPVVVALGVLSALGAGAILTLLTGPWMWLSLLVLPAITAGALFLLSRMGNSNLRRTLQFSLIISLAGHLLILIITSLILIFHNGVERELRPVAKRTSRTIKFTNKNSTVSIPVSKPDNTPEPEVEIQRNRSQVTSIEQPVPVQQTSPTITPQTTRREITQRSVSRFDEALSQLRRNRMSRQAKSSIANKSPSLNEKKIAVSNPSAAAKPETTTDSQSVTAVSQADSITRSSAISGDRKVVKAVRPRKMPKTEVTKIEPRKTTARKSERSEVRPRLTRRQSARTDIASPPSISRARVARAETEMRKQTAKSTPRPATKSKTSTNAADMTPAESSGQLTRRPRRSEVASSSKIPSPLSRKKTSQPRKTEIRRRIAPTRPTVTNPLSSTRSTRLATNDAPTIRSIEPANRPAPNPKSTAAADSIEPRTLSITKGQSGTSGGMAKLNLQTGAGGLPSPSVKASDAMLNRREQSPNSNVRMLTNSQASRVRRSTAEAPQPTSAFRAETSAIAKIAGSKSPTLETAESSAADITSAASRSESIIAIEKGAAPVNLGPTKVVAETQRRRLSGGGAPDVASLNPSQTRRSSAESEVRPTIADAELAATAAPRETAAQPTASDSDQPTELAELTRRSEGPDSQILDHAAAPNLAPTADEGSGPAPQLAAIGREIDNDNDQSQLREFLKQLAVADGKDDDEEEAERMRRLVGNAKVRVARAPNTAQNSDPVAGSEGDASAKDGSESAEAQITSRSQTGSAFSTADLLGKSATRMAMQSVTSLPVIEGAISKRSRPTDSNRSTRNLVKTSNTSERARNEVAPNVSAEATLANAPDRSATGSTVTEEATGDDLADIRVARTETARSDSGLAFDIAAIEGPAGLDSTPNITAGIKMRPASEESRQIQPELDNRFRRQDFGGAPAMNPTATIAKEAFRRRTPGQAESEAEPKTEAAIHLGLEFLVKYQQPDGSWSLTRFDTEHRLHKRQLDSDMAATGLAVLAFQGAGYNHLEFKYARQVNHGIRWLIKNQGEDGLLYLDSDKNSNAACRLYSHGIAALALTEAYGMTQDPSLKEPAQKALDYITGSQHPTKGGWRYFAEMKNRSSDTSVSGWMVMALQSGRLSGLKVEDKTFESIVEWLAVAADPVNDSLYRYNPYAVNSQGVSRIQGRNATPSMTAVGLLMRIYTGWEKDDPRLLAGARYLVQQQLPGETAKLRDTYYWYYATQVLKHVDGETWKTWNRALRPLLIRTQEKTGENAGSWDPYAPVPDRWAPFGGRLYLTTMNLLSLEVRHRLLPLYQKTNDASAEEEVNPIVIREAPFE